MMMPKAMFALLSLALLHSAVGQPFMVEPETFEPDSLEALKRMENNYTGFVFDFKKAPVRHVSRQLAEYA